MAFDKMAGARFFGRAFFSARVLAFLGARGLRQLGGVWPLPGRTFDAHGPSPVITISKYVRAKWLKS